MNTKESNDYADKVAKGMVDTLEAGRLGSTARDVAAIMAYCDQKAAEELALPKSKRPKGITWVLLTDSMTPEQIVGFRARIMAKMAERLAK